MSDNFFSDQEIQLILESLLFSSNVDICSNFYKEDNEKMIELAKKIRKQFSVPLENVFINEFEGVGFLQPETRELLKYFPELERKEQNF